MKFCKEFLVFCEDKLECVDCYHHIGKLNREQHKYELRKKYGSGIRGDNAVSKQHDKEMQEMR